MITTNILVRITMVLNEKYFDKSNKITEVFMHVYKYGYIHVISFCKTKELSASLLKLSNL